ncbi:uncharacterized protein LOC100844947 [Brachypodium distachyon]|uniref:Uncharacterized protein n=1 Tax=Brachypodium distachyon TaxID=15368 RepID=A0A2K2DSD2_BRADI|nr:uncharacterized protein LOC100844947 [Brachypodium distachyon]XP_024317639.1 uncharacterized protein LOC100844947 [Brachypodium distachyon]PNT77187.1 hypothetical protein BRADI_1g58874v3 [Brachypodium distachyon]|eukprot:XP_024317636.1 uncharacterized protein LOC100844947 [Brachypodium distachyon]
MRRGPEPLRSVAATPATTAQVRTRRQSSGSQSARTRKRKRRAAGNQRSNKRKSASEEEKEEEVSSAGSSPLRELDVPDEIYDLDDPEIWKVIDKAQAEIDAKLARRTAWATLNMRMLRGSMCVLDDPKLVPDRESARKAVLNAAQSFVGLTSSVGGKPLARSCGFWVHWDEEKKIGTVLTTSRLICTKSPSRSAWLGQEEYDIDAEVLVHLRGNTTEKAQLQYHQKHYDLAFFKVKVDKPVHILPFNDGVKHGDQVLELGRDEQSFLRICHGVGKNEILERKLA